MEFFISKDNKQVGPLEESQLLEAGLTAETLVWASGWPAWRKAEAVPELTPLLQGATPPPIPPQVTLGGATTPPPLPQAMPAAPAPPAGGGNAMFSGVKVEGHPAPTPAPAAVPQVASATAIEASPAPEAKAPASTAAKSPKKDEDGVTYKPALTWPWMPQAIIATIFFCLPVGLMGIYYANLTKKANEAGDTESAKELSNKARLWTNIAFGFGLVAWTVISYFFWQSR